VNVPTKGIYDFVLPAAMVAGVDSVSTEVVDRGAELLSGMAWKRLKRAAFVAAMLAVAWVVGFERWRGVIIRWISRACGGIVH